MKEQAVRRVERQIDPMVAAFLKAWDESKTRDLRVPLSAATEILTYILLEYDDTEKRIQALNATISAVKKVIAMVSHQRIDH